MFNSNNVLLNIVKTNINLLNDYGLNPTSFSDLEEIIFNIDEDKVKYTV